MPSLIRQEIDLMYWNCIVSYPSFMRTFLRPSIGYNPSHWNNEHEDAYTFTLCMKFSTAMECAIVYAHDLIRGIDRLEYDSRNFKEANEFPQLRLGSRMYKFQGICTYYKQKKCHTSLLI
jgi:hypothetical protein